MFWPMIERAAQQQIGKPNHSKLIKQLQQQDPRFEHLSHQRIGKWRDKSVKDWIVWSKETINTVKKEFLPGGHQTRCWVRVFEGGKSNELPHCWFAWEYKQAGWCVTELSSLWLFGMSSQNELIFLELFIFYFLLGLITTPYVHMTYVYSFFICFMFLTSHNHMAKRSHYCIMIFSTSEFYSMDTFPPSFSSTSSITPPPLYSPSTLINNSPTWRRIPPGQEKWSSRRSLEYNGRLSSLQTRHCQGWMGPSINEVNMAGWVMLSGTLTRLGKVWPPIVVRRVVPTWSWLANALELAPLQLSRTSSGFPLNHPPSPISATSLSIFTINPVSLSIRLSLLISSVDSPASMLTASPP